jgi:hypothetical protein
LLSVYDRRRRAVTENPSESHAKDLVIAIDRLIRLYDRWGKSGESAKWRKERDALPAANPSR